MPLLLTASVSAKVPAPVAWRAVVDWPGAVRWVPLTTVQILPAGPGAPDRGNRRPGRARSGIRVGVLPTRLLDGPVVTGWTPPDASGTGEVEVLRHGPLLGMGYQWNLIEASGIPERRRAE